MSSIAAIADRFFADCETGQGWGACKAYCTPDATFGAQAEPLAGVTTLEQCLINKDDLAALICGGPFLKHGQNEAR